jgi:hypothetical protein
MWRDAVGGVKLARKGSDAEAHVQVANGAGVVNRIEALRRMVEGEPQEKEGSVSDYFIPPDPEQDETEREFNDDLEDAYAVLDELEEQIAEACEEQTEWREEIDRQNLRKLLDDIDAVQRVKLLIRQIVDPREQTERK